MLYYHTSHHFAPSGVTGKAFSWTSARKVEVCVNKSPCVSLLEIRGHEAWKSLRKGRWHSRRPRSPINSFNLLLPHPHFFFLLSFAASYCSIRPLAVITDAPLSLIPYWQITDTSSSVNCYHTGSLSCLADIPPPYIYWCTALIFKEMRYFMKASSRCIFLWEILLSSMYTVYELWCECSITLKLLGVISLKMFKLCV